MDVALAIDSLVPGAVYSGSPALNTQAAYDALVWSDQRAKPSWAQIQAADATNQTLLAGQAAYKTALKTGVQVNSTATPALDGAYDFSAAGMLNVAALQVSLNAGKALPQGATTVKLKDMGGAWHTFAEADLTNLAVALRDYVYAWDLYLGGQAANAPVTPLQIA